MDEFTITLRYDPVDGWCWSDTIPTDAPGYRRAVDALLGLCFELDDEGITPELLVSPEQPS